MIRHPRIRCADALKKEVAERPRIDRLKADEILVCRPHQMEHHLLDAEILTLLIVKERHAPPV